MLIIAEHLRDLSFGMLMEVYREGNRENGVDFWPNESPERQLALAEQDFYDYLSRTFFCVPGAYYALWSVDGRYVSALRMEPYRDGFLISGLETAPEQRRRGYAKALLRAVLDSRNHGRVYSHVSKRNLPSLRTHASCGFQKILDHAVYADGSILTSSVTLLAKQ